MKTIQISNSLFGALWLRALEFDKSEEDILRRLLGTGDDPLAAPREGRPPRARLNEHVEGDPVGYADKRYGVAFPQGFKIFRTYKGNDYIAHASGGKWLLQGREPPFDSFNTLSALSKAIGAETENAWFGWRYQRRDGGTPFVAMLRPDVQLSEKN